MIESPLHTVISGAQVGADIAGLRAAHSVGLRTGGYMPRGWRTLTGPLPAEDVIRFGLKETGDVGYPGRTILNVLHSDGTLQLAYNWGSRGEKLTSRLVRKAEKANMLVSLSQHPGTNVFRVGPNIEAYEMMIRDVGEWIKEENIGVLNVAGNADPLIELCVEAFLVGVFTYLGVIKGEDGETTT